eukprot:TRINITY_DN57669_c0_g1_i1.p1 TRINITY_DN57669_c0_g1~~TRINITY_DN57669_c0_g1_i1.p1  ORF type:complete len:512 (+),score=47.23 TRINITY_DN57669_c0_g1_i1:224-1537(+)
MAGSRGSGDSHGDRGFCGNSETRGSHESGGGFNGFSAVFGNSLPSMSGPLQRFLIDAKTIKNPERYPDRYFDLLRRMLIDIKAKEEAGNLRATLRVRTQKYEPFTVGAGVYAANEGFDYLGFIFGPEGAEGVLAIVESNPHLLEQTSTEAHAAFQKLEMECNQRKLQAGGYKNLPTNLMAKVPLATRTVLSKILSSVRGVGTKDQTKDLIDALVQKHDDQVMHSFFAQPHPDPSSREAEVKTALTKVRELHSLASESIPDLAPIEQATESDAWTLRNIGEVVGRIRARGIEHAESSSERHHMLEGAKWLENYAEMFYRKFKDRRAFMQSPPNSQPLFDTMCDYGISAVCRLLIQDGAIGHNVNKHNVDILQKLDISPYTTSVLKAGGKTIAQHALDLSEVQAVKMLGHYTKFENSREPLESDDVEKAENCMVYGVCE